jgi:hypothetical protein
VNFAYTCHNNLASSPCSQTRDVVSATTMVSPPPPATNVFTGRTCWIVNVGHIGACILIHMLRMVTLFVLIRFNVHGHLFSVRHRYRTFPKASTSILWRLLKIGTRSWSFGGSTSASSSLIHKRDTEVAMTIITLLQLYLYLPPLKTRQQL